MQRWHTLDLPLISARVSGRSLDFFCIAIRYK